MLIHRGSGLERRRIPLNNTEAMSGHSKWSTIKRRKGAEDAKRGKVFTKVVKEITIAARSGGGDPDGNPRLRRAIDAARSVNMPADNITRAIKKGTGELEGVQYEELVYEGIGADGALFVCEVVTDNRNRTIAEVRKVFDKNHGQIGNTGTATWAFEQKGVIVIENEEAEEETVLEIALENGADDVKSEEEAFEVVCSPHAFEGLRERFTERGIKPQLSEVGLYPKNTVKLDREHAATVLKLVNALEDNDDVQQVSANFDIPDEILQEIESEL